MGLQIWLPLNGNVYNQGLSDLTFSVASTNTTVNDSGKIGKCYENNSFTAGGLLSDKEIYLGQNQSMFCWFKINSLRSNSSLGGGLVTQHRRTMNQGMGITIRYVTESTGYLSVNTGNGDSRTYNTYYGNTLLQAGVWYHGGYTYDGTTIRLYVNGVLDGSFEYSNMKVEPDYIYIFRWSLHTESYSFDGCLNDVRIYDNVLSPREIKEISKGLVLHYLLSSGGGENILLNTATPMELDASAEYRAVNSYKTYSSTLNPKQLLLDGAAYGLTLSYNINVPAIYIDSGASLKRCGAYLGFKVTNKQTSNTINYYGHHSQSGEPTNLNTYIKTNALNSISSSSTASNPDTSFNGYYSRTIYPNQFDKLSDFYNNPDNYDVTFTGCHIEIRGGYIKDKCSISNLKLEVGDKATPWTPNPADDEYAAMGYDDPIEYDVSGYGYNGTMVGNPQWCGNSPRYTGSLKFGSNIFIHTSREFYDMLKLTQPTEITVSIWAYMNPWEAREGNGQMMVSCQEAGGFVIYAHSTSKRFYFAVGTGLESNTYKAAVSPTTLTIDTISEGWHLFTGTYDGMTVKLYIDSELVASTDAFTTPTPVFYNKGTTNLIIGGEAKASYTATNNSNYFDGQLSDFRLYYTALTDNEVMELYHTPITLSNNGTLLTQGELSEV